MGAGFPSRIRTDWAVVRQELASSVVPMGLALGAAIFLGLLCLNAPLRWLAFLLGGAAVVLVAWLSGNPRLFCLWGFALTMPLNLSQYFGQIYYTKAGGENGFRIESSELFLAALAGFLAWDILCGRRRGLRIPKVSFLWLAIMFMGFLAMAFSRNRLDAAHEVVRMAKLLLLFLVVCNELERPRRFLHCAAALTLSVTAESVIGLIEYVRKANFGLGILGETDARTIEILAATSVRTEKVFRVSAFLLHPNLLGIFLAASLPLAVGLFLYKAGKGSKLFFLAGVVVGISALVVTFSRSGWVSFAVAVTVVMSLLMANPGLRRRTLLTAAAAALILAGLGAVFYGPITTRVFESKEDAMLGRAEFEADAKRMIAESPWIGWGLNSYVDELPAFSKWPPSAFGGYLPPVHHIYYLWWAETGLVGLMLHLAMWGSIVWTGVRNLRVKNELLYTINAACLGGMIALGIDGFFSFSLRVSSIFKLFWVLAGMILAVHYWRLCNGLPRPELKPVRQANPRKAADMEIVFGG